MSGDALLLCRDPVGLHWQLGPLPPARGSFSLLGWKIQRPSVDAGVPPSIAIAILTALTRVATLTFPCSEVGSTAGSGPLTSGPDRWTVVSAPGDKSIITRSPAFGRTPASFVLLSTRDPSSARCLFDDAMHPWWLQGQFALLSGPAHRPHGMSNSYAILAHLLEQDWATVFSDLEQSGVNGILKPGVDGDVIGILSASKAFEDELFRSLAKEVDDAGMTWAELPESEFAQAL